MSTRRLPSIAVCMLAAAAAISTPAPCSGSCSTPAGQAAQQWKLVAAERSGGSPRRAVLPARRLCLHDHAAGAERHRHTRWFGSGLSGKGYNVLPIWKDRMDSRAWIPTPNADVIYSMSYLDLKETGPLVVAAPPNVIGMFTDFFQRTITDVGLIGPDRARGGLYLLLPPDYERRGTARLFCLQVEDLQRLPVLPHHHGEKATVGRTRNRPSRLRNGHASIRCGPWRRTSGRWSFPTAAASGST